MSTLETGTIEPQSGTTVTLGTSGDAVVIGADALKVNTVKDAGANTIFTSDGSGTLSSVNSGLSGNMVYINKTTASTTSSISFTSGIDSTYDEYVFYFVNMNPVTDAVGFGFQFNASGGSGFNETITSTAFYSLHKEDNTNTGIGYYASADQAQGTAYQPLVTGVGNASDECFSGILHLFAPSSTTYVKHFYALSNEYVFGDYGVQQVYIAGYVNTTSAIDEIDFKFTSGYINEGTIYLYGIK